MPQLRLSTQLIVDEANRRNWPVDIIDASQSFVRIHPHGTEPVLLKSVISHKSNALAAQIADFKNITAYLASENGIATPHTEEVVSLPQAISFLNKHTKVVVKPLAAAHSNGVTIDITGGEQLRAALLHAQPYSKTTLIQQQVDGMDIRLLFIGKQFAAAAIRESASVTGDGRSTIRELIDAENRRPERGENYQTALNIIPASKVESFLGARVDQVPNPGEMVKVVGPANIGAGGVSTDITEEVDQTLVDLGRKVCEITGLAIGGVDFIMPDPRAPVSQANPAYLIEVNSAPTLGLHERPHFGKSRAVSRLFLDWLTE